MSEQSRFSDPGYTPARGELDAAIHAMIEASDDDAAPIERSLARAGVPAALLAQQNLNLADPASRVRLLRLIARVARENPEHALVGELCARLSDPNPNVQRASVIGLGKLNQPGIEDALLDYAAREHALPEQRVLIEALGKVGGPRAAEWLVSQTSQDDFTTRVIERARLMLARTASRPAAAELVRLDIALGRAQTLLWTCREGLESIVAEQVSSLGAAEITTGRVCLPNFAGALSEAFIARSALSVGVQLKAALSRGNFESRRVTDGKAMSTCWVQARATCFEFP